MGSGEEQNTEKSDFAVSFGAGKEALAEADLCGNRGLLMQGYSWVFASL
jgi:hypothetical protein